MSATILHFLGDPAICQGDYTIDVQLRDTVQPNGAVHCWCGVCGRLGIIPDPDKYDQWMNAFNRAAARQGGIPITLANPTTLNAQMTLPQILTAAKASNRYQQDIDHRLLTDWLERAAEFPAHLRQRLQDELAHHSGSYADGLQDAIDILDQELTP
jgi:hypothetical protein